MSIGTFNELLGFYRQHGLEDTRFIEAEEKITIFIYIYRFSVSQTITSEVFGRSPNIISRAFH